MENETKNLEDVRNISFEANNSVQVVATSTIKTIGELNSETIAMEKIFDNIESLAAIAEENAASSEEVSASVSTYTNEIKKLLQDVVEFKNMTEEFKKDLAKYKI